MATTFRRVILRVMLASFDPPRDQLVTSSELVRQFGKWQERAARDPVYILHRGRPRFVMTSVELMEALCAPLSGEAAAESTRLMAVLDGTAEMVLVGDAEGRVAASSRAARAHFGNRATNGAPIVAVAAAATQPLLAATLARVTGSGVTEEIELPSASRPDRRLTISVMPYHGGVVLIGTDESAISELRAVRADVAALRQAVGTYAGAALTDINLRGYLDRPGPDLAALSGVSAEALGSVRFVTLLDIADRVPVAEAIEGVIADGMPRGIVAALLVNRASPVTVRIGLAARRPTLAVEGVTALLVTAPTG
ncbi:MAG: hypothetical protein ABIS14_15995 [Sphingomonas sp.]